MNTFEFDHLLFAGTLNDALYIQQTLGSNQKLIYADYDWRPKIFPTMVLNQRGMAGKTLDSKSQKILEEKFK